MESEHPHRGSRLGIGASILAAGATAAYFGWQHPESRLWSAVFSLGVEGTLTGLGMIGTSLLPAGVLRVLKADRHPAGAWENRNPELAMAFLLALSGGALFYLAFHRPPVPTDGPFPGIDPTLGRPALAAILWTFTGLVAAVAGVQAGVRHQFVSYPLGAALLGIAVLGMAGGAAVAYFWLLQIQAPPVPQLGWWKAGLLGVFGLAAIGTWWLDLGNRAAANRREA